ncbi:amino acid permease-domain-containing protein, partial [Gorgonomyces haynaldii]
MTSQKFTDKAGTQLDMFSTALERAGTAKSRYHDLRNVIIDPIFTEGQMGTIDGVFLPVFLSVWGVIAFLRLGFVVGQAGMILTLVLFSVGYFVCTLTTLSLSAICTNGTVRGGGPYYILSRTLGPEFGGSIGIVFYIGSVLSGVMSLLGFVEPLLSELVFLPSGRYFTLLYTTLLLILCLGVSLVGGKLFSRATRVLSLVLILATLSFMVSISREPFHVEERHVYFSGMNWTTLSSNLWPRFSLAFGVQQNLQTVFSLVFPACTGIMAGASMSGDLKSPSRSIPLGTLSAQLFTYLLYFVLVILMAGSIERETLVLNMSVMQEITVIPFVISLGVMATCLYSTLGSIVGGSKIFQAMARDEILPGLNYFKHNQSDLRCVLLTFGLMQICLFLLSDMNEIAPIITMFSLLTFGVTNLATFALKLSGSPNFRPSFQYYSTTTALLGCALSLLTMVIIDVGYASLAVLLTGMLFLMINYFCPPKSWGDVTQSLIYHQVRKFLLRLDARKEHVKFWRPQILFLVHDPRQNYQTIKMMNDMKKGGLFILGHILKGSFEERLMDHSLYMPAWLKFVDLTRIKAFVQFTIAPDERIGCQNLLLGTGLGGMRPNMIVLGSYNPRLAVARAEGDASIHTSFPAVFNSSQDEVLDRVLRDPMISALPNEHEDEEGISCCDYVGIIEDCLAMGKAVAVAHGFEQSQMPLKESKLFFKSLSEKVSKGYQRLSQFVDYSNGSASDDEEEHIIPLEDVQVEEEGIYLDLWPLQTTHVDENDEPSYTYSFDSYTLVLQLGTILGVVPHWKKTYELRVNVFVEFEEDADAEFKRVCQLLKGLRIKALVRKVWLQPVSGNGSSACYNHFKRRTSDTPSEKTLKKRPSFQSITSTPSVFNKLSPKAQHMIMNQLMKAHSDGTKLIITTLAAPDQNASKSSKDCLVYLEQIKSLVTDLPPILLVHGKGLTVTMSL